MSADAYFLPYQDAWLDDESPVKLFEKSRRIGATYATSYRCVQKCLRRKNFTQWVSSVDALTAKEFIQDYVATWCRRANIVAEGISGEGATLIDPENDITAFIATFPATGSRIVSLSSRPEAYAGKGGDVLLDEVDLRKDAARAMDMAMPCIDWGGQVELVSAYAPDGSPSTPFARLVAQARAENPMGASLHRCTILDAVAQGLVEKINAATGRDWSREEFLRFTRAKCRTEAAWRSQYLCEPQDDGGALLPYHLLATCETAAPELERGAGLAETFYAGMDVARRGHLSVLWKLGMLGDVLWSAELIEMHNAPFHAQLDRLGDMLQDASLRRLCIDSTGLGMMLAEEAQRRHGRARVEAVTFTAAAKMDLGLNLLRSFEDRRVRIPDTPEVREDLHKIRRVASAGGNVRLDAAADEEGHADRFWALALAVEAATANAPSGPAQVIRRNPLGARAKRLAMDVWA
jgi:phage FluMu gp28-like protein